MPRAFIVGLLLFAATSAASADFTCWSGLAVFGPNPGMRFGHAMAYFPPQDQIVLFGGSGAPNTTWVLPGFTWSQAVAGGPAARQSTAVAYHAGEQRLIMFSGSNGAADTWAWNGAAWAQRFPATSPGARNGHALAYDSLRNEAVLFGGAPSGGGALLADTWVYTGTNWVQRVPGVSPLSRRMHAMAYDPGRRVVWMFGGNANAPGLTLGDLWRWDGATWAQQTWVGSGPTPRSGHAMVYDRARCRLVVYGGFDQNGAVYHDDTWEWDGAAWKSFSPVGAPSVRTLVAAAYDSSRGRTILYGGQGPALEVYAETYSWEVPVTPTMTSHPAPLSVMAGQSASFSVTAAGAPFFTYQWRRNGVPLGNGGSISGAFGPTLMIAPVRPGDAGAYDCIVSNRCAETRSRAAGLAVCCLGDSDCNSTVNYTDVNEVLSNWLETCP